MFSWVNTRPLDTEYKSPIRNTHNLFSSWNLFKNLLYYFAAQYFINWYWDSFHTPIPWQPGHLLHQLKIVLHFCLKRPPMIWHYEGRLISVPYHKELCIIVSLISSIWQWLHVYCSISCTNKCTVIR